MLFVVIAVAVVLLVPAVGGRYRALADIRLRHVGVVVVALVMQVLVISVFDLRPTAVPRLIHVVSYALIGEFLLANRHLRWIWVVGVGWASNALVILVNGGVMPMDHGVARVLGEPPLGDRFVNSAPLDDPRLAFLGDVFITPAALPLRNSFSVGDLVLYVGLVAVVVAASRPRSVSTATREHAGRARDEGRA